jgi:flagellar basal body rod protein FlgG
MSNVSTVMAMIDLITTSKGFELYTRTSQSIEQMNQAAITQVGRRQS